LQFPVTENTGIRDKTGYCHLHFRTTTSGLSISSPGEPDLHLFPDRSFDTLHLRDTGVALTVIEEQQVEIIRGQIEKSFFVSYFNAALTDKSPDGDKIFLLEGEVRTLQVNIFFYGAKHLKKGEEIRGERFVKDKLFHQGTIDTYLGLGRFNDSQPLSPPKSYRGFAGGTGIPFALLLP